MKRTIFSILILIAAFILYCALFGAPLHAQRTNTIYVDQMQGSTVAAKTVKAQAQCLAAVKCVLIFDPILGGYALGTMPSKGANEFWADYAVITGSSDLGAASGSFTAGGDLSGTTSSQTVNGIKGHALPSLSAGYPHYNGSAWVFDTPSGLTSGVNTYTSSHTIDSTDNGKLVLANCPSACSFFVPNPNTLPVGFTFAYAIKNGAYNSPIGGWTGLINGYSNGALGSQPVAGQRPFFYWTDGTDWYGDRIWGWGDKLATTSASSVPLSGNVCIEMDSTGALVLATSGTACPSTVGGGATVGLVHHVQAADGAGGHEDTNCTVVSGVMTCGSFTASGANPSVYTPIADGTTANSFFLSSTTAGRFKAYTQSVLRTFAYTTDNAPGLSNPLPLSGLATQAADSIDGNFTGSTAAPTASVLPNCADTGGNHLNYSTSTHTITCGTSSSAAGGGYVTVQDEASSLTARSTLNFTGAGVTCADNAGSTRTDCTIPGGSSSPAIYFQSTNEPAVSSIGPAANGYHLSGFALNSSLTLNFIAMNVATLDNSANRYAYCIYDSTGTLVAHADVLNLSAGGFTEAAVSGAPVTLTAGRYYIGTTGNAAVAKFGIGSAAYWSDMGVSGNSGAIATGGGTSCGGTVTLPSHSTFAAIRQLWFALR